VTFYLVTLVNDRWTITTTKDRHRAIAAVKSGETEAYFEDLIEASRFAEDLRKRDAQTSHVVRPIGSDD
jgi:hypothetical protein